VAADPVLGALAAACPAARPALPGDAVAGVLPRFAASPATVAEASALLRAAAAHDLAVVARGGGSKLDWGAPPRRCDLVVDTTGLDQVLEHAAGDLVVRAQAGVPLARLADVLAGAGQQLALDPAPPPPAGGAASWLGATVGGTLATGATEPSPAPPPPAGGAASWLGATVGGTLATGATEPSPAPPPPAGGAASWLGATIGGTLATGAAGPRRLRYGTPRDLLIGITVVRADGAVASAGGKVVKNVAGYDLGKLFTGSFGTLGLIVEAVFRLHPRPASTAYVTLDCAGPGEACRAVAAAAGSVLAPSAVELDRPGRDQPVRVAVLLEGDPDGTAERAAQMSTLLGEGAATQSSAPGWWGWPAGGAAAAGNGQAGTLIRVGFWAAGLPRVLRVIDEASRAAGLDPAVGGSAAAGVIYVAVGPDAEPAAVAALVSGLRAALARGDADARPASAAVTDSPPALASAVVVHAPPAARDLLDLWGPVSALPLMRAVKDQFDPGHRMAPGRFAGGI
jgi:glycolate oxidase FAD binding subunit